jgi:hypothetical protein
MDDSPEVRPAPAPKPSTIPSWAMLGFIVGALFMWSLNRSAEEKRTQNPPVATPATAPTARSTGVTHFTDIEAVFAEWGKDAVWENDTTEVALWNDAARDFVDCFEVLRIGDHLYFRSIPRLTRPVLTHGVNPNSPLQLTEPQSRRQEWLKDVREETWRDFSNAVRPPPVEPPPSSAPVVTPAPAFERPGPPPAPWTSTVTPPVRK